MPSINEQVAERIKSCAPAVEGRLVDMLVEKEVSRRVELIGQGLAKLTEFDKEKRKLDKPSDVQHDRAGNVIAETYTKETLEAIKKHEEKTGKLQRAVDKALAGDLGDLPNLLK